MTNENNSGKSFSMSPSVKELATALIAVQADLPTITKDKLVQGAKFSYTYASLDTVMPEALAILNKNGLALTQTVGTAEDGTSTTLSTMLLHKSGEWLSDTQPLLLAQQDPQAQGSAITYARRYGLMAVLGMVADEDDDGAAATPRPAPAVSHPEMGDRARAETGPEKAADNLRPMAAKFPSECYECGYKIEKGEPQFFNIDVRQAKHQTCPEGPPEPEKAPESAPVAAVVDTDGQRYGPEGGRQMAAEAAEQESQDTRAPLDAKAP